MSTVEKQKAQTMYGVEPYVETKGEEYMGEPMKNTSPSFSAPGSKS